MLSAPGGFAIYAAFTALNQGYRALSTATLGFKIDSTQASSAAVDLEKLYAAAAKLDKAADSLEASTRSLNTAIGAMGQGAQKAKTETESVGRALAQQDDHVRAFRVELERLTMKFQPLSQATRSYEGAVSEINKAHKLGIINAQQMQQALDRERAAFERLKTSALGANQAVQAANQNGVSGAQRAAGINAGYQFQDIAVTAAMGMNPLMIGLQQGTQLASVVSSMERPVAGLASAFVSLINPVSLITIGLTAGVAALVQYFATADEGSKELEEHLAKQGELIENVAARWGDAYPALKAYADELQRAREETDLAAASSATQELRVRGLLSSFDALATRSPEISRALRDITSPEGVKAVQDYGAAMVKLRADVEAGVNPTTSLTNAQSALRTIMEESGSEAVRNYSDAFGSLAQQLWETVTANKALNEEIARGKFGGTSVQDLLERNYFVDNDGRSRSTNDFVPRVPGIPTSRPSDLARDPDVADTRIMNSDGRLTGVPIPGQKPNIFELEKENEKVDEVTKAYRRAQEAKADFWLDLSFSERQAGRSAMDRQIANTMTRYGFNEDLNSPEANALREQLREGEARDIFKGFFSGVYSEAWANGGKIGDAIVKSALNAAQKASEKAWDAVFDKVSGWLTNLLTGGKNSAPAAGADIVTKALSGAANDNSAMAAPVGAVARSALPATTEIGAYIRDAAIKRGIDPDIALRVAKSEGGLDSWNLQSNYVKNGVREPSFGPFQLYKGGGLGNAMMKQTGLDPALAANGPAGVDFALDNAKKSGWGQWYGAGKAGIGDWEGIDKSAKAVKDLGAAATDTAKMTAGLGQTLASIPQALMANGGGAGALSSLTKYGMGLFGGSQQFASAWLKGGIGLYANGTNYSPGGPAIVGENGPELLNLPQGSAVTSNHKLMSALAANQNGGGIAGVRLFVDQDGNWQAKVESIARKQSENTNRQALGGFKQSQQRTGFGDDQKRYNSRKG